MVRAIGQYGKYLKPSSHYEFIVPMFDMKLEHTHKMLTSNKEHEKSMVINEYQMLGLIQRENIDKKKLSILLWA